ncbi:hypothetical protein [Tannerella forsythia]|uniref:hypothetical protein n=1 Tax=Tannerella forsythia TaxID=28112 RepID=UPI00211D65CA|nr:hypothetical protein [Tannerella forsythia]
MALQAKLYAGCRVNGVVDTLVVRNKTPQQTAVGSIYDSINFKSCNVALPKPQTLVDIRNLRFVAMHNTLFGSLYQQLGILCGTKRITHGQRRSHVQ